ncbi:MAG: aspartate carbamoyltransferase [Clostridium sp.]|nr:aspartate carbamoyltransferase [Clostridium sp.]
MMENKHLIDPMDFSIEELDEIFCLAQDIMKSPEKYSKICDGKILATLFYEPSTRTRFSFEAAMMRLGGKVLGFSEPNSSSASKGETLADTIKMVSIYSDIIAMRHPLEGSARVATQFSSVPIINAGDGGHQHPTQTLADLLTITCLKGNLTGHTIGICGDLRYGRTVHSLIKAMSRYKGTKFILISPKELRIPAYIREEFIQRKNIEFREVERLDDVIEELDILYMTRIQKERFFNEEEYLRLKDSYILDEEKMKRAKEDMIVMHPLPRVNEIAMEVDSDKRASYFKEAECGMYVRMALMCKLLGVK